MSERGAREAEPVGRSGSLIFVVTTLGTGTRGLALYYRCPTDRTENCKLPK
jgi:thiamine monophosphate kinase